MSPEERRFVALGDVERERYRQAAQWAGKHAHGSGDCSSPNVELATKVAVLTEEVGEVARAYLENDVDQLRTELVQVAAVAVAIIEGIDHRRDRT
jgi:hypothetical protein